MDNCVPEKKKHSLKQVLLFLIPSLIGLFIFMVPIHDADGNITIFFTVIQYAVTALFSYNALVYSTVAIVILSAILAFMGTTLKMKFIRENKLLAGAFICTPVWYAIRVIGAVIVVMVILQKGPEWLIGPDTGTFVLWDLMGGVMLIGILAGLLMPFLTEFGLMEFIGTLIAPVWKKVFKIPGRSAVDCISSWVGANMIAVYVTSSQIEKGQYTKREGAIIASTFSAVSISYVIVILAQCGLEGMFFQSYGAICIIGIVCAVIVPRIPPLSRIPNEYDGECHYDGEQRHPENYNAFSWAWKKAVEKAGASGYAVKDYFTDLGSNFLSMTFGLAPVLITVGTLALVVAYYTPVFSILGYPFQPLLQLLQVPEASSVANTMVAGFADMFIPAALAGATITSEFSRMLVAIVSITQLIFMSETGCAILASKVPLNILQLFVIYIERTIISILVAVPYIAFVLHIPMM